MTQVLLYSLLVSLALLASSVLSFFFRLKPSQLSFLQHFAAGVIFAAVAVELVPHLLNSPLKWDIALGFLFGLFAMLAIRKIGETKNDSTLGMTAGFGVDLWIDGILVALSFAAATSSGLVVTFALGLETVFLMCALVPSLKQKGASVVSIFTACLIYALVIPFGAWLGFAVIEQLPGSYFLGILAFGVSALLFLVTEELLVEAHETIDTSLSTSAFFLGFLLILLL